MPAAPDPTPGPGTGSRPNPGPNPGRDPGQQPPSRPSFWAAFVGLVDDAAIFPPGDAPMPDALRTHAAHEDSWYAALMGPFVCADTRLSELQEVRRTDRPGNERRLWLSLTVTGGAGAIEPALTWVARDPGLQLAAVEVALRDEADLAHNAARMTTVLSGALPDDANAYVEMPRLRSADVPAGWLAALDEVAASGYRMKYRTGGLEPDAFPSENELAVVIDAAIEREVEVKCTAGLHHAVAHTATDTGFDHHGFLNVLLATRAALDGARHEEVAEVLRSRDGAALAASAREVGAERLAAARRWFRSFGSCSVLEPRDDLVDLGLVAPPTSDPPGETA